MDNLLKMKKKNRLNQEEISSYESFMQVLNKNSFNGDEFSEEISEEIFKPIFKKKKEVNHDDLVECFSLANQNIEKLIDNRSIKEKEYINIKNDLIEKFESTKSSRKLNEHKFPKNAKLMLKVTNLKEYLNEESRDMILSENMIFGLNVNNDKEKLPEEFINYRFSPPSSTNERCSINFNLKFSFEISKGNEIFYIHFNEQNEKIAGSFFEINLEEEKLEFGKTIKKALFAKKKEKIIKDETEKKKENEEKKEENEEQLEEKNKEIENEWQLTLEIKLRLIIEDEEQYQLKIDRSNSVIDNNREYINSLYKYKYDMKEMVSDNKDKEKIQKNNQYLNILENSEGKNSQIMMKQIIIEDYNNNVKEIEKIEKIFKIQQNDEDYMNSRKDEIEKKMNDFEKK